MKTKQIIDLLKYKKQIILQGPPGTGKTRLAKELAANILGIANVSELPADSSQFKLAQFHPSYSYEDFVRGITAKINEEENVIVYEAENKILARLALEASEDIPLDNAKISNDSIYSNIKKTFSSFVDHILQSLEDDKNSFKFYINKTAYIAACTEKYFKYSGDNWKSNNTMRYSDITKLIIANVKTRKDVQSVAKKGSAMWFHATYYLKLLEKYYEFSTQNHISVEYDKPDSKVKEYVLIIDEINRANLSSVLGELIYALEYRGESVEGMYEVDGSNKLVLPPNLYIIGTMNTADRSVGHIDYAIRRRFAFVDVLPEALEGNFETALFYKVSQLFVKNPKATILEPSDHLSSEFHFKDVWLGHSYFIKQENVPSDVRLKYEVIPILEEYVKDGVLKDNKGVRDIISELKNWKSDAPEL